ncbi:protein of unknown function [Vibrio tapetis subsp. tapetis]|uniref:Uncharacterized protein n=1 Tax=Vibrio tapetis subsp. tapetis TaxID=1671868 RepID=A0A2N8ZK13_9VIBR|nr:protein of unknown function [Vibrio tapetis subsp. tapetis]
MIHRTIIEHFTPIYYKFLHLIIFLAICIDAHHICDYYVDKMGTPSHY